MSFLISQHSKRKENVSCVVKDQSKTGNPQNTLPDSIVRNKLPHDQSRRTSVYPSAKGGLTIEAALTIPLFFLALLCMVYLLEMTSIQIRVRSGMHDTAKKLAQEVYTAAILSPGSAESSIVDAVGSQRLDQSIVIGGSSGIDCSGSYVSPGTKIIHLKVRYEVRIPIPKFGLPNITFVEQLMMKGWTGYEKGGMGNNVNDTVYITDTASVYHKDYHCSHIDLSIQMVAGSSVGELRNAYQGRYHACSKCARGNGNPKGAVYVAKEGDCYHTSLGCSGLKRKVYAVPLSQVVGKGACSRCGQ